MQQLKPFLVLCTVLPILLLFFLLAGCGSSGSTSPTTPPLPALPTPISKFTVTGTAPTAVVNPSPNNPFTSQVSVTNFGPGSSITLITIPKVVGSLSNPSFSESATLTTSATYPAYQSATQAKANATASNGILLNDPLAATMAFRQSELQLLQGSRAKTALSAPGINALVGGSPDPLGNVVTFWINADGSSTLTGDVSRTATCRYVGTNIYIYVDNAINDGLLDVNNSPTLQAIGAAFDGTTPATGIYNIDRAMFGSEYKPGIDNDNRITILISPAVNNRHDANPNNDTGMLGYFWGRDEFPQTTNGTITDHSNMREMFYVSYEYPTGPATWTPLWADAAAGGPHAKNGYAVLAHEFQHMINFYQKTIRQNIVEDIWLNEGLSMYAMQACGYGVPQGDTTGASHVKNYLDFPESFSLTTWTPHNYGISYLFVLYLVEQYGQGILATMESNNLTGINNVESVTATPFATIFKNWAMANLLDGIVSNPVYNYSSLDLHGTYGGIVLNGIQSFVISTYPQNRTYPTSFGSTATNNGWTAVYQKFTGGTNPTSALNLSISTNNSSNNLEAIVVVQ